MLFVSHGTWQALVWVEPEWQEAATLAEEDTRRSPSWPTLLSSVSYPTAKILLFSFEVEKRFECLMHSNTALFANAQSSLPCQQACPHLVQPVNRLPSQHPVQRSYRSSILQPLSRHHGPQLSMTTLYLQGQGVALVPILTT